MILLAIEKIPFLRRWYFEKAGRQYMRKKLAPFLSELPEGAHILDIGSGGGLATSVLREMGFTVTPLDIRNGAYHPSVEPLVYDGRRIPFNDRHFDAALLLTVLHHIDPPEPVLEEACRIANKVCIVEDIYRNPVQQYLTYLADRLVNLFYSPCPHTNKTDREWHNVFRKLGLSVSHVSHRKLAMVFLQTWYVLERRDQ